MDNLKLVVPLLRLVKREHWSDQELYLLMENGEVKSALYSTMKVGSGKGLLLSVMLTEQGIKAVSYAACEGYLIGNPRYEFLRLTRDQVDSGVWDHHATQTMYAVKAYWPGTGWIPANGKVVELTAGMSTHGYEEVYKSREEAEELAARMCRESASAFYNLLGQR